MPSNPTDSIDPKIEALWIAAQAYHDLSTQLEYRTGKDAWKKQAESLIQAAETEGVQLGRDRQQYEIMGYLESIGASEQITNIVAHFSRPLQLGEDYKELTE